MNGIEYEYILVKELSPINDSGTNQENGYLKVITTGHVIEIYQYEKIPTLPSNKKKEKTTDPLLLSQEIPSDPLLERQRNMQKTRNRLRRLITANFDESSKFVTLTFKENLTCVKTANNEFKKFIQRLRRRYNGFKYITVIEFQERGAVHYHMMSDLPFIANSLLADIWGHGFVKINEITHVDNVGAYMIKYMCKDNEDLRLTGLKSYQASRGLTRSVEFVGEKADEIIKLYNLEDKKMVFTSAYENEYLGLSTYKEYNLKRL